MIQQTSLEFLDIFACPCKSINKMSIYLTLYAIDECCGHKQRKRKYQNFIINTHTQISHSNAIEEKEGGGKEILLSGLSLFTLHKHG